MSAAAFSERAIRYDQLVRQNPAFRNLWLGEVVSFAGDWFNTIALFAAVQELTDSGQAIAAVMVAKLLPPFLVTPLVGPIIDRFERRRLLIISDIIRAGAALGLIVSYTAGSLLGLYASTVVLTACTGLAMPTRNAVLPMIVEREHLVAANALSGGTWSAMLAIGALLGGIATQFLGIRIAFGIDAATFVMSMGFFLFLPRLEPPPAEDGASTGFIDGVRYLLKHPYVLSLTMVKPLLAFGGAVVVLIPFFGTEVFANADGPFHMGLIYGFRGTGAVIGAFAIRLVVGDMPRVMRRSIVVAYLVAAGAYLFLSYAGFYWQTLIAYLVGTAATSTVWVFSGALLQMDADPAYHGRVFSLQFGILTLWMAAASWLAGWALDHGWTEFEVARVAGAGFFLPFLFWLGVLLVMRSRIRRLQPDEPDGSGQPELL